jgi:hypothetical protein
MNQKLNIQELAIAIVAEQHSPTLLTPDFLKYSGVVPADWQLARPPVATSTAAQVIFQNGVNIVAQGNRITFAELIGGKEPTEVAVAEVARRYGAALPQVTYQAVGINLRGVVPFDGVNQTARQYLFGTLLSPGPWQEFGQEPVQAALRFVYGLEQGRLDLEVLEAKLQRSDQSAIPALLFSGSFSHEVAPANGGNPLAAMEQVIANWPKDLAVFTELVNQRFLQVEDNFTLTLVEAM